MKMKRICMVTLSAVVALCSFVACDSNHNEIEDIINDDDKNDILSDLVWDMCPIDFMVMVEDAQGNDLLDSVRTDNILDKITVSYLGEDYSVQKDYPYAHTRVYVPRFRGLVFGKKMWGTNKSDNDRYMLDFGEFDGGENVNLREIKLDMGDGNILTLAYKNSFKWNSNSEPDVDRTFYLNGEAVNNPDYVYHFQYTSDGKLIALP
jgi:hypothetical protein